MILADNGSSWYLSGAPDERWNNDDLHQLQTRVHGSDFEAVDTSSLMVDPGSGQARTPSQPLLKPQAYLPIYGQMSLDSFPMDADQSVYLGRALS